MRVSKMQSDPGYQNWLECHEQDRRCLVLFNDRFIEGIHTADDEQGFVARFLKDADGNVLYDPERGAASEVLCGKVTIVQSAVH